MSYNNRKPTLPTSEYFYRKLMKYVILQKQHRKEALGIYVNQSLGFKNMTSKTFALVKLTILKTLFETPSRSYTGATRNLVLITCMSLTVLRIIFILMFKRTIKRTPFKFFFPHHHSIFTFQNQSLKSKNQLMPPLRSV